MYWKHKNKKPHVYKKELSQGGGGGVAIVNLVQAFVLQS